jgi:hypothetical protein
VEIECSALGVSVAQFLREAALARLAYTAGRRGDVDYVKAYAQADAADADRRSADADRGSAEADPTGPTRTPPREHATQAEIDAHDQRDAAAAANAQSEQVWRRSRDLREQAAELRRRRRGRSA